MEKKTIILTILCCLIATGLGSSSSSSSSSTTTTTGPTTTTTTGPTTTTTTGPSTTTVSGGSTTTGPTTTTVSGGSTTTGPTTTTNTGSTTTNTGTTTTNTGTTTTNTGTTTTNTGTTTTNTGQTTTTNTGQTTTTSASQTTTSAATTCPRGGGSPAVDSRGLPLNCASLPDNCPPGNGCDPISTGLSYCCPHNVQCPGGVAVLIYQGQPKLCFPPDTSPQRCTAGYTCQAAGGFNYCCQGGTVTTSCPNNAQPLYFPNTINPLNCAPNPNACPLINAGYTCQANPTNPAIRYCCPTAITTSCPNNAQPLNFPNTNNPLNCAPNPNACPLISAGYSCQNTANPAIRYCCPPTTPTVPTCPINSQVLIYLGQPKICFPTLEPTLRRCNVGYTCRPSPSTPNLNYCCT